jgi:hypothetical protein
LLQADTANEGSTSNNLDSERDIDMGERFAHEKSPCSDDLQACGQHGGGQVGMNKESLRFDDCHRGIHSDMGRIHWNIIFAIIEKERHNGRVGRFSHRWQMLWRAVIELWLMVFLFSFRGYYLIDFIAKRKTTVVPKTTETGACSFQI